MMMLKAISKKVKNSDLVIYTVLWLLCCILLLRIFRGRTFFWIWDGFDQHFASFYYLCDYLKNFIYNHQIGPFFNFTLGQGMDIITTLNSYDFTDPVSILCALVYPLSRTARYTLMVFAKLYLIGISFIFYCRAVERKNGLAIALGAIAYVFSGAILFTFARHPNFINWAYFFPFLLGGVELYFRKGKRTPLILSVFLNIVVSYYTFYVDAILVGIYVLIHAICNILQGSTVLKEGKKILRLAGICCTGISLSAFILFPTLHAYFNSDRMALLTGYTGWHYPLRYYVQLIEDLFIALRNPGFYCVTGLNTVIIVPLILIFLKRKKHTALKLLLIISFLMMCIPLAGRIMNGFGYVSNRWTFAIPFYASVAFVVLFEEIGEMAKKEQVCILISTLAYIGVCLFHTATNMDPLKYSALLMLIMVVFIIGITLHCRRLNYRHIMSLLVLLGAFFQVYFTFAKPMGFYSKEFLAKSGVTPRMTNLSGMAAPKDSSSFYRIEMEEARDNENVFMNNKGTGFRWSMLPSYMMDYYIKLALDSVILNCFAHNLDGRTGLLSLASVKYYTRPAKKEGLVPYGYKEITSKNKRHQVFENPYTLPIGYTYSGYIPYNDYRVMNGIEKEQALIQGAIIDVQSEGLPVVDAEFDSKVLNYTIEDTKGIIKHDDSIKVTAVPGRLVMNTIVPKDCETYVYIKGIKLGIDHGEMRCTATRKNRDYSVNKYSTLSNLNHQWPVLRDDVAFNLGYGHDGENKITITFNNKGTVFYDDIQIIAVPMTSYVTQIKKLKEHVLENVNVGNDKVTGTISLPEERILQFSIPYSDGWKALVDDKETVLLKSNVMYMALPLKAGNHTIELTYRTPYLREGMMVTGITGFLWALYEFLRKRRHSSGIMGDNS